MKDNKIKNDKYTERQIEIAKFELNNLNRLNEDLSEVVQAMAKAYARFGQMPTSIVMLSEDDFNAVDDLCIDIKNKFDYSTAYLSALISDIDEYYKPSDYYEHKKAISSEAIDNDIKRFIAEEVDDVEVRRSGLFDDVEYGYIVNTDLYELGKKIGRDKDCIKSFKRIK